MSRERCRKNVEMAIGRGWRLACRASSLEFTKRQQPHRLRSTLRHHNRIPPDWGVVVGCRLPWCCPPGGPRNSLILPTYLLVFAHPTRTVLRAGIKKAGLAQRTKEKLGQCRICVLAFWGRGVFPLVCTVLIPHVHTRVFTLRRRDSAPHAPAAATFRRYADDRPRDPNSVSTSHLHTSHIFST